MGSFREFLTESPSSKEVEKAREWLFNELEDGEMDIDELRDAFIKKFGKKMSDVYDEVLSDMMD